mgnify:CR=1 FL=1
MRQNHRWITRVVGAPLALPADVAQEARRLMSESRAKNTQRAYAADWKVFAEWCAAQGRQPFPANPDTVAAYIVALSRGTVDRLQPAHPRKLSTITRHLATISVRHREAKENPVGHVAVREIMRGLRRDRRKAGEAPRRAAPADLATLKRLIAAIDASTIGGCQDRALLLLGFAAALRSASIVGINVEDVKDFGTHMTVTLREEKTRQTGEPRVVGFHSPDGPLSVRDAIRAWTRLACIKTGPLFRRVTGSGRIKDKRLGAWAVTRAVHRAAATAGLKVSTLRSHSLRAGFITEADANGASLTEIMKVTGQQRPETVLGYIRHTDAMRGSAATKVWGGVEKKK